MLPFSSILSGSPRVTLQMIKPSIDIVRNADGQINALALFKKGSPSASGTDSQGKASTPPGGSAEESLRTQVEIPAVLARARLGFEVRDGSLRYVDEQKKIDTSVERLRVLLPEASILRPTSLSVEADINTKVGKDLSLAGPVIFSAVINPVISSGSMKEVTASMEASGSDLQIDLPGLFQKKKGVALGLTGKLGFSSDRLRLDALTAKLHESEITLSGTVEQPAAAQASDGPQLQVRAVSKSVDLASLAGLMPILDPYKVSGSSSLEMEVKGPVSLMRYNGKVSFSSVKFSHPKFKVEPKLDGSIQIATNELQDIQVNVTGPGSDLKVSGKLQDFLKPRIALSIESSALDLDQWINLGSPKAAAKSAAPAKEEPVARSQGKAEKPAVSTGGVSNASVDFDALLEPLRKNAIASATTLQTDIQIKKCKVYHVALSNLRARATLQNLVFALQDASFEVFDGRVLSSMKLDLKPARPTYSFTSKVDGLQIQKAVESQLALFKNTLFGSLSAQAAGSGSSFNPDSAMQSLSMKGSFEVRKAKFATLDVGKMVFDGINQSIAKVAEKVPPLKGKQLGAMGNRESLYEIIRSDFQLNGGKFTAPNFSAKAEPKNGLDLSGSLSVTLKDLGLQGRFDITDTYNLTKAEELSVDIAGVTVPRLLAEKGKPVRLPIVVECTVSKPCPKYMDLAEHFTRVALANTSGAAGERAKSEAKKAIGDVIKKKLPGGLNKFFR
ncbi:hypothetical protein EBZ37_02310 [bacterium]|nr:hypothetical protein [bacterium]